MTLQHSNSKGIRPLWARGTGNCYPKQLSSPASCGAQTGGRGRARANLGTLPGGMGQAVGRSTRPSSLPEQVPSKSSLIGFSADGRRIVQSPPAVR